MLTLSCPFCQHEHADDFECLDSGRADTIRCENPDCNKRFVYLVRECLACSPAARRAYLPEGTCRGRRRWWLCFASVAESLSVRYTKKQKSRVLLSEFSSTLGNEILRIRIYRDSEALVCERELLERDGRSFTMVVPLRVTDVARALLTSDPYYPRVRGEVRRTLGRLEKSLHERDGNPVP